jgi:hypothetical protein
VSARKKDLKNAVLIEMGAASHAQLFTRGTNEKFSQEGPDVALNPASALQKEKRLHCGRRFR